MTKILSCWNSLDTSSTHKAKKMHARQKNENARWVNDLQAEGESQVIAGKRDRVQWLTTLHPVLYCKLRVGY
jgi:hypothetical protein